MDISSRTLTPTHREAIARCWGDQLLKAKLSDRIRLVSFLLKLHPYFPDWRLLSWEIVKESMLEDDFVSSGGADDQDVLAHMVMLTALDTAI